MARVSGRRQRAAIAARQQLFKYALVVVALVAATLAFREGALRTRGDGRVLRPPDVESGAGVAGIGGSRDGEAVVSGPAGSVDMVAGSGPGVLRMGMVRPASIDPASIDAASPSQTALVDLIYDGLTRFLPEGDEPVGELAESFGVSEDGLRWTFNLRAGARFADGSPIEAADVAYSLGRMAMAERAEWSGGEREIIEGLIPLDPGDATSATIAASGSVAAPGSPGEAPGPAGSGVEAGPGVGVVGVEAPDARTVVVRLRRPFAPLPALLASPMFGILPRAFDRPVGAVVPAEDAVVQLSARVGAGEMRVEGFGGEAPVGSGPLGAVEVGEEGLRLRPGAGRAAGVQGIDVTWYGTVSDAFAAVGEGVEDVAVVPAGAERGAGGGGEAERVAVGPVGLLSYVFDVRGGGPAGEPGFRRAVLAAVDRSGVSAAVGGASEARSGLTPDNWVGYRTVGCGEACRYDRVAAQRWLAETYPGQPAPKVGIAYPETEFDRKVVVEVARDLEAVGFPVELRPGLAGRSESGGGDLVRWAQVGAYGSPEVFVGAADASAVGGPLIGVADPFVDQALATARAAGSIAFARESYRLAELRVLGQFPLVPLVAVRAEVALSGRVEGFVPLPAGGFALEQIEVRSR